MFYLAVLPAALAADQSTCKGDGLSRAVAGVPAAFSIRAGDRFGNVRTNGGDDFRVTVTSVDTESANSIVTGKVDDLGQGAYRAQFVVNFGGAYHVAVTSAAGPCS